MHKMVSVDGYEADIETIHLQLMTPEEATSRVEQIADEIESGIGVLTAVGAERTEVGGTGVIQFYCVMEDLLPGTIDVEDLTFSDEGVETKDAFYTDEEPDIRVSIFPVFEEEVTKLDG